MNLENIKSQMRKGILEYSILLLLSKQDSYASQIISAFKDGKMIVVEGTIYPLLTRLKKSGLLSYRWEESNSGPPRKYYFLTDDGRIALKEMEKAWEEIENAIDYIQNKTA